MKALSFMRWGFIYSDDRGQSSEDSRVSCAHQKSLNSSVCFQHPDSLYLSPQSSILSPDEYFFFDIRYSLFPSFFFDLTGHSAASG